MVVAVQEHDVKWLAPTPVWSRDRFGSENYRNGAFNKPAILRFDNDEFMEELMSMIAYDPDRMPEWLAVEETWREPMRKPPAVATLQRAEPISRLSKRLQKLRIEQKTGGTLPAVPAPAQPPITLNADLPFKLYQPAQQRYYLVAASLVCRNAGLPDRTIDAGKQEQVRFVVRRVAPNDENQTDSPDLSGSDFTEYAFVTTELGFMWKQVDPDNALELETDEERLPLFAMNFDHNKQKRRILSGLVPVGRREAYLAAPRKEDMEGPVDLGEGIVGPTSPLGVLFQSEVAEPWKVLEELAFTAEESMIPDTQGLIPDDDLDARNAAEDNAIATLKATREQIQTASWYVLLDFAIFLRDRLPRVWDELNGHTVVPGLELDTEKQLKNTILSISQTSELRTELSADSGSHFSTTPTSLLAALNAALAAEDDLENIDTELNFGGATAANTDAQGNAWPSFVFPLAHPRVAINESPPLVSSVLIESDDYRGPYAETGGGAGSAGRLIDLQATLEKIDALIPLVEASLPDTGKPPPELEPIRPPFETREPWFVIRCVYERPNRTDATVPTRVVLRFGCATATDPDPDADRYLAGRASKIQEERDASVLGHAVRQGQQDQEADVCGPSAVRTAVAVP